MCSYVDIMLSYTTYIIKEIFKENKQNKAEREYKNDS